MKISFMRMENHELRSNNYWNQTEVDLLQFLQI